MNATDTLLNILFVTLAVVMAVVGVLNWLNRRHGGFAKGFAGAFFIGICWAAAILIIVVRIHS